MTHGFDSDLYLKVNVKIRIKLMHHKRISVHVTQSPVKKKMNSLTIFTFKTSQKLELASSSSS